MLSSEIRRNGLADRAVSSTVESDVDAQLCVDILPAGKPAKQALHREVACRISAEDPLAGIEVK